MPIDDASYSKLQGADYISAESPASETLSDIEDLEVCNLVTLPVIFRYCSLFP